MRADYHYYGVHLKSDWLLPYPPLEKQSSHFAETIQLRRAGKHSFSRVPGKYLNASDWFMCARLHEGLYYIRWKGLWDFLVSAKGTRITARRIGAERMRRSATRAWFIGSRRRVSTAWNSSSLLPK